MKTEPSKLEQALRDSPGDVFEARASNGVEVEIKLKSAWVHLRTPDREVVCCTKCANSDFRWVAKQIDGRLSYAPHILLTPSETLHAIAEVLEMLNGEREWGEE